MPDSQAAELAQWRAISRGIDAARQALFVSGLELELARESRLRGEAALAALEEAMAEVRRSITAQMVISDRSWHEAEAALGSLMSATTADQANDAVIALAASIGVVEWLPFADDEDFKDFIDDEGSTLVLGDIDVEPQLERPSDALLARLGEETNAPVDGALAEKIRGMVADRSVLAIAPFAGMHVSVKRTAGYRHHGVLLGDGTVAHYQKLDRSPASSVTVRTSVADFMKGSDPASLKRHFPVRKRESAPAPVFMPNLTALRALRGLRNGGYGLFGSNCEHFASWAQCGAMISGQADQVWRAQQLRAAQQVGDAVIPGAGSTVSIAMGVYLECWTMTVGDAPVAGTPQSREPADAPDLFDIGRIRWAADREELLWWLPMWTSEDPERTDELPFGPRDRPWCTGTPTAETTWHSTPPSIEIDKTWHASILMDPDSNLWIVDSEGRWWRGGIDIEGIVQARVAAIQGLNQALAQRDDVFELDAAGNEPELPGGVRDVELVLPNDAEPNPVLAAGPLVD